MLKNSSPIASGNGAPNTAIELANTSRGLWPALRTASSSAARAVHVDAVALVEVLLGLARDDRREMEDHVGLVGDQLVRLARSREIAGCDVDRHLRARRHRAGTTSYSVSLEMALPPSSAVPGQPLGQLAPDHARAADDQNLHAVSSVDSLSPLSGERVRVRGRRMLRSAQPPLTLTLSPCLKANGERG